MGRILVVDDSDILRNELDDLMRVLGHQPVCAAHGADALAKATSHAPIDLVITDYNMPQMDGIELTEKLKAMPAFDTVPVIMLTTENCADLRKRGLAAGIRVWLVKPLNSENLTRVIQKLLVPKAA